jgi:hypothetical protein
MAEPSAALTRGLRGRFEWRMGLLKRRARELVSMLRGYVSKSRILE